MSDDVRTAIVTGASSGVGAATALRLAGCGVRVAVTARRADRLEAVSREIVAAGGEAVVIPADLTVRDTAERVVMRARDALGTIDALVVCAGTNTPARRLDALSVDGWDHLLAVNLSAAFYCLKAVLPGMRAAGKGSIVFISSVAGLQPSALSGAAYSAAKAGLNALSACINLEEGENRIRSCVVCPGDINTEILDLRPNPPSPEQRQVMLQADDVARLVVSVLHQPPHAWVDSLVVRPRR